MTPVCISLNEIPLQGGKENIFSVEATLRTLYNTFKLSLKRFYYSISLREYRRETRDYFTAGFSPVKMAFGQIKIPTEPLESKLIASPTRYGLLTGLYGVQFCKRLYNSIRSRVFFVFE